jgi:hypothetical protein
MENYMEAKEISKGIQIEKEAQNLSVRVTKMEAQIKFESTSEFKTSLH